jgi:hypothetical protein
MPPKIYCGKRATPPDGKVMGTRGRCYQKGVGVGASGFEIHGALDRLTKDIVREYCAKLKVKNYSHMSKEELIDRINASGKYRQGIQSKMWYK